MRYDDSGSSSALLSQSIFISSSARCTACSIEASVIYRLSVIDALVSLATGASFSQLIFNLFCFNLFCFWSSVSFSIAVVLLSYVRCARSTLLAVSASSAPRRIALSSAADITGSPFIFALHDAALYGVPPVFSRRCLMISSSAGLLSAFSSGASDITITCSAVV